MLGVIVLGLVVGALWLQSQENACEQQQARVREALREARAHQTAKPSSQAALQTAGGVLSILTAMNSARSAGVCFDAMYHVGSRFVFHGRANSAVQLSAFMETWPVSPWFSSLTLSSFTRQDAQGAVRFEFSANENTAGSGV